MPNKKEEKYNQPYDKSKIEIYTDASFCPFKKIGSYAFLINYSKCQKSEKGYYNVKIENSTVSELKCIQNALLYLIKSKLINNERGIYVYTDSKPSIKNINKNQSKYAQSINYLINTIIGDTSVISVRFVHVKSHSDLMSKHTFNNDICDKNAKEQLDILRQKTK